MWNKEEGLLLFLKEWSEQMRQKPGNLNKNVLDRFDSLKQEITPFYFNHQSFDSQWGPYLWFNDIVTEFKNILVGYDTKEMKGIMTGRSSYYTSCDISACASVTSLVSMENLVPQKYYDIKNAIEYNISLCLKLAKCHETQMRVSMKIYKIDENH